MASKEDRLMYKCKRCGEIFEEPWETYEKETGARESGCPYCGSDYYDDTYICAECGDYGAYELGGLCEECKAAVFDELTQIKRRLMNGGMSEYDAVTVVQDWVEAS